MPTVETSPDGATTLRKSLFRLADEQITVNVGAVFTVSFAHDPERGGYTVTCKKLPEVVAHGPILTRARADARRKIVAALESREDRGESVPLLTYSAPLPWAQAG